MQFQIQIINNIIEHDFSQTLIKSLEYQNWLHQDNSFSCFLVEKPFLDPHVVPVGSVEFVQDYFERLFSKTIKPINIPEVLLDYEFTGRKVFNGIEKDINKEYFVKSNDKIKSFTEITKKAPIGNYQISELIDFESEYRCFIYKDELVGIKNYTGDFKIFPDIVQIDSMIKTYKKTAPIAYTLDVGIFKNKTLIIEVHDFFSCGLYGFDDHRLLPYMFFRWFNEFKEKNKL